MNLTGTPFDILRGLASAEACAALEWARQHIEYSKRQVDPHEAAVLYTLARGMTGHILEIGTALGYSAAVLAQAAPEASITTLTPSMKHYSYASQALAAFPGVRVLPLRSWDYLSRYRGPQLSMIFVDGYHGMVIWDLPWWDWLETGGLMLFHDYSPLGAMPRQCEPVYQTLTAVRDGFREFDVLVVTDGGQGMCGWYKAEGEKLPALDVNRYSWCFSEGLRDWLPGVPDEQG